MRVLDVCNSVRRSDALRRSSFSIIYHPAKTLDLVAKNALEYRLWTRGLNQLVQEIRQNRPVEKLQGARGAAGAAGCVRAHGRAQR